MTAGMPLLLTLLLGELLLIAPISLSVDASGGHGFTGLLTLRVWGVRIPFSFRWSEGEHQLMIRGHRTRQTEKPAPPMDIRQVKAIIGAFLRCNRARKYLLRHVKMLQLDVSARLSLGDAAGTALVSGLLAGVAALLPGKHLRLRITPDFWSEHTTAAVRCILFTRLGNLLLTALLFALALLLEMVEERRKKPNHAGKASEA